MGKSGAKMYNPDTSNATITTQPADDLRVLPMGKWPRKKMWPYQLGLAAYEMLMVFFMLWACGRLFDRVFAPGGKFPIFPIWIFFCALMLSFAPAHALYSYHLVFAKNKHRTAFSKAVGWGLMALAIIMSQHMLPMLGLSSPYAALALFGAELLGLFCLGYCCRHTLPFILRVLGIALIAYWLLDRIYEHQPAMLDRLVLAMPVAWLFSALLVYASRSFLVGTVYNKWLRRSYRRQVGIVGSNADAGEIISHIIAHNAPFWVVGTIGRHWRSASQVPKNCLGDIVDLPAIAKQNRLSDLIVTHDNLDRRTLISLLDYCLEMGVTVWVAPKLMPIIDRKIYINNFCGIPMIRMCSQKRMAGFNRIKHRLDACFALLACLALSPFFAIIAAAIKLDSKGPVFYRARAVGENGRQFQMFKFRSMSVNSDASIHKAFVTKLINGEIGTSPEEKKPLKITHDPRVTRVGRMLRKYSLDELPQLFNVLMGQMSLIGPRPCLPYEFDVYQDWYKKRAAIRPGITGIWQVAGRSEVAFEEMILLDLYYLYNRSLWMDLNLLLETAAVVLNKKGAY